MIQNLRDQMTGIVAYVIIGAIALTFALFGITEYFNGANRVLDVASVDGEPVTNIDLDRAFTNQQAYLVEQMGENFDPSVVEPEILMPRVLDGLVNMKVLEVSGQDAGIGVSDGALSEMILDTQIFHVGGQFSESAFRQIVVQMGFTSETFTEALKGEGIVQQLSGGLISGAFHSKQELEQLAAVLDETRDYQFLAISSQNFVDSADVSEEQIEQFFTENNDAYTIPEKVIVSYIEVNQSDFLEQVEVSAEDIEARYQELAGETIERREVAHILITSQEDGSDQATIDQVQQGIDSGIDFASLAEEYSDDIFSAAQGGVIGDISSTEFPESFEFAASQLSVGEVSAPTVTDSGTHFIKLISLEESSAIPFEDVRESILADLQIESASEQYEILLAQLRRRSLETIDLEHLVENVDSPVPLTIQQSQPFSRELGEGVSAYTAVRQMAFSEQVLARGENSDPISVSDTSSIIIHHEETIPSRPATLNDVRDSIAERLKTLSVSRLTAEYGQSVISKVGTGQSLENISITEDLDWQVAIATPRNGGGISGFYAFSMTEEDRLAGFSLGNGDYLIVQLDEVTPGEFDAESIEQQRFVNQQLSSLESQIALQSYTVFMRNNRDVEVNSLY